MSKRYKDNFNPNFNWNNYNSIIGGWGASIRLWEKFEYEFSLGELQTVLDSLSFVSDNIGLFYAAYNGGNKNSKSTIDYFLNATETIANNVIDNSSNSAGKQLAREINNKVSQIRRALRGKKPDSKASGKSLEEMMEWRRKYGDGPIVIPDHERDRDRL